ncbi:MAG: divergent polysaccharide deacetylase family protein [bacterium]
MKKIIYIIIFFFISISFTYHYYLNFSRKAFFAQKFIDNNLIKSNIYPKDIIEEKILFKKQNFSKWPCKYKKIAIPKFSSFQIYQKNIFLISKKINAKITSCEKENSCNISIKLNDKNIYFLTLIKKPSLVLIIDDFGYGKKIAQKFLNLKNIGLTFSILPHLPYSLQIAQIAQKNGFEIILHLPMEPCEKHLKKIMEKQTIMNYMQKEEIEKIVQKGIKSMPEIKGVNQHMGSKIIQNKKIMEIILTELKKENLYFIDSLTNSKSVVKMLAKEIGIQINTNNLFIDNKKDIVCIKEMLNKLVLRSLKKGEVIGIGHVNEITFQAIKESIPLFKNKDVWLFYASQLVK